MGLINSVLCYPIPSAVGWYLQVSILLTLVCITTKLMHNKKSQLSYFLAMYFPVFAIPYLLLSKQREDKELSPLIFIPWLIIVVLIVLTRLCLYQI